MIPTVGILPFVCKASKAGFLRFQSRNGSQVMRHIQKTFQDYKIGLFSFQHKLMQIHVHGLEQLMYLFMSTHQIWNALIVIFIIYVDQI